LVNFSGNFQGFLKNSGKILEKCWKIFPKKIMSMLPGEIVSGKAISFGVAD